MRGRFGLVLVALAIGACATGPAPFPTWPVAPEQLAAATSGSSETNVTCGVRTFPMAELMAPGGAEKASGPEFDALRATLAKFGGEFPGSSRWTWQLVRRDDAGATFLAQTDALGPPGWVAIDISASANGWSPRSMGQCDTHVVLPGAFGPARWELDPSFTAPTADVTQLHILVWEQACSNGSPATGRISAPVVQYGATTVTITLGVRPLEVAPGTLLNCGGPPGTPATMTLAEPVGQRTLIDGGNVPPDPASPANP